MHLASIFEYGIFRCNANRNSRWLAGICPMFQNTQRGNYLTHDYLQLLLLAFFVTRAHLVVHLIQRSLYCGRENVTQVTCVAASSSTSGSPTRITESSWTLSKELTAICLISLSPTPMRWLFYFVSRAFDHSLDLLHFLQSLASCITLFAESRCMYNYITYDCLSA